MLERCELCPRKCKVNRNKGELGYCKASDKLKVARYSLHMWEEPIITGEYGSGTIFFSNCNLKCIYCQNYQISDNGLGKEITIEKFNDICQELQRMNATNINLVTPTIYVPLIIKGIALAKKNGLKIPVVYNTSSYECIETIKSLKRTVNIYLADLKYINDDLAFQYSNCTNYFNTAKDAISEMYKNVGKFKIKNGILKKGLIVRHLVLPNHLEESKMIIKYLYETYNDDIIISVMNQYTPVKKTKYEELNRSLTKKEYDEIINYIIMLGVQNCYVQEGKTCNESFIPDFENSNV